MKQIHKQFLIIAIVWLTGALFSTAFGQSPEKKAEAMKLAEKSLTEFMEGNLDDAKESATLALDADQDNPLAHVIRGRVFSMKNEMEKAREEYLTSASSDYWDKWNGIRSAFYAQLLKTDLGLNHEYTKESLENAIRWLRSPKNALEYYARGIAQVVLEKNNEAIADFNSAIKLNPKFVLAYRNRALIYNRKNQYDLAIADLTKAIGMNPKISFVYSSRGDVYFNKGAYDQAFADYTKVTELNSKDAQGYAGRGDVYRHKHQTDLALAEYTKSVKSDPDYFYAHYALAGIYHNAQQYDKAIEEYAKVMRQGSTYYADALINRGNIYLHVKGDATEARRDYESALKKDPQNYQTYIAIGNTWYQEKRYDLAQENYTKAIELNPDNIDAYSSRANAYLASQQSNFQEGRLVQGKINYGHEAKDYYANAKKFGDLAQADFSKAIDMCTKAIRANQNDIESYFKRGNLYLDQKQFDLAIADYFTMVKLNPQTPSPYFNRAIAYYALGRDQLAAADRQQYKKLGGTLSTEVGNGKRYLYPDAPFDASAAKAALSGGTATIIGKASTKALFGLKKYIADDVRVTLIPATSYVDAWYKLRKEKENKNTSVQLSTAALQLSLETNTDENGQFQFSGLKPGRYYVYARNVYVTATTKKVNRGSESYTNETGGRTNIYYYDWETNTYDHDDLLEEFVEVKQDGETVKFSLNKWW